MSIAQSLFGGGNFPSQPTASGTTVATTEFPKELAPFIKDILEKSKAMQSGASYQPYTGAQIAPFNPLEQESMTALEAQTRGLAGTDVAQAAPYFTGAKTAIEGLGQQFTGDTAQQFMNPYQQAVTDQAKLKATEDYEAQQNVLAANAIKNQPFGGSRQAITEGMAQGDYLDRLSNIQERGLAAGFTQGRAGFEAQKGRELQQANALMGMGAAVPQQAYRDLGIRQQIGETQRAQDQMALDLGTKQFMEEREFPTRALQEYSATVRGFPFQPSTYQTTTNYQPSPGIGQQLVNLAGQGLGGYTAFTGQPMQNLFKAEGGITTLPTYYNQSGDNDQRPRSIYDLINTQTEEAQQFYAEQALAQEQQELAEAQQLDAMDLEYYIEEQNRPKSLIEKVGNILYAPQQGIKNLLNLYDRKQIGNRLRPNLVRPNLRRAEGGITSLPVYYNEEGENEPLWYYKPEKKQEFIVPNIDLNNINLDSDMFRDMSMDDIQKMITIPNINTDQTDNNFSVQPFIGGDSSVYTPPLQLDNNANMVQDMDITNITDLLKNIPDSEYIGNAQDRENYLQMIGIKQPISTNAEETVNNNVESSVVDNILYPTETFNVNSQTAKSMDTPTFTKDNVNALGIIGDYVKPREVDNYDDYYMKALKDVDFKKRIENVLSTYDYMGGPEYAEKLMEGATTKEALGQGLAMMKAFSSSDPTQGIIGNLSNQIGRFAEEVGPSESEFLDTKAKIENLGTEMPIASLDAIINTLDTALDKPSTRQLQNRKYDLDDSLEKLKINVDKDTQKYHALKLLYDSNLSENQFNQKAVEINNLSDFNTQTLKNDLLGKWWTYQGTLAAADAELGKLRATAIEKGLLSTTEFNNIYQAVGAGLIGEQVLSEAGGLESYAGKPLNSPTMIRVNQAVADIMNQVAQAKMMQNLAAASGYTPADIAANIPGFVDAATLQAQLISQYKSYYDGVYRYIRDTIMVDGKEKPYPGQQYLGEYYRLNPHLNKITQTQNIFEEARKAVAKGKTEDGQWNDSTTLYQGGPYIADLFNDAPADIPSNR